MTAVSWPLIFLWVVCFAMVSEEKESFWLAFLAGLWLDFLKGSFWGETSLIFLVFVLLVSLYKKKFKVIHPLYFFPFVGAALAIWEFWVFGRVEPGRVFWGLVLALGLLKVTTILIPKKEEIKL